MRFRLFGVTLLAGGVCIVGVGLAAPATGQQADVPLPTCEGPISLGSVSQERVQTGESVDFSTCGFAPGSTVTIDVNGARVQSTTADASGNLTARIILSIPGDHYLTATGTTANPGATSSGEEPTGVDGPDDASRERKVIGMVWADSAEDLDAAEDDTSAGTDNSTAKGGFAGLPFSGGEIGAVSALFAALIGGGVALRVSRRRRAFPEQSLRDGSGTPDSRADRPRGFVNRLRRFTMSKDLHARPNPVTDHRESDR